MKCVIAMSTGVTSIYYTYSFSVTFAERSSLDALHYIVFRRYKTLPSVPRSTLSASKSRSFADYDQAPATFGGIHAINKTAILFAAHCLTSISLLLRRLFSKHHLPSHPSRLERIQNPDRQDPTIDNLQPTEQPH